jgi:hypothetical protein
VQAERRCLVCAKPLPPARTKPKTYCDAACRARGWRRRKAGIAEHLLPDGRRGRLGLLTQAEREEVSRLLLARP